MPLYEVALEGCEKRMLTFGYDVVVHLKHTTPNVVPQPPHAQSKG